jgi:hypothetical protein
MKGTHVFLIRFSDILAIKYTTFELAPLPRSGLRKKGISTPRQSNSRHTKYVAPLEYFLNHSLKADIYFYRLFGPYAHKLQYKKVWQLVTYLVKILLLITG